MGDALAQVVYRLLLWAPVTFRHLPRGLPTGDREKPLPVGDGTEEQDAPDCLIRVLHLIDACRVSMLAQEGRTPTAKQLRMQELAVNRCQPV